MDRKDGQEQMDRKNGQEQMDRKLGCVIFCDIGLPRVEHGIENGIEHAIEHGIVHGIVYRSVKGCANGMNLKIIEKACGFVLIFVLSSFFKGAEIHTISKTNFTKPHLLGLRATIATY